MPERPVVNGRVQGWLPEDDGRILKFAATKASRGQSLDTDQDFEGLRWLIPGHMAEDFRHRLAFLRSFHEVVARCVVYRPTPGATPIPSDDEPAAAATGEDGAEKAQRRAGEQRGAHLRRHVGRSQAEISKSEPLRRDRGVESESEEARGRNLWTPAEDDVIRPALAVGGHITEEMMRQLPRRTPGAARMRLSKLRNAEAEGEEETDEEESAEGYAPWTEEEDDVIRPALEDNQITGEMLKRLPGRTRAAAKQRLDRLREMETSEDEEGEEDEGEGEGEEEEEDEGQAKRRRWARWEVALLRKVKDGKIPEEVLTQLQGRSRNAAVRKAKQLRDAAARRLREGRSERVEKSPKPGVAWTEREDALLRRIMKRPETSSWEELAVKYFPDRSDRSVSCRWHRLSSAG
jgi:hypothetical protein